MPNWKKIIVSGSDASLNSLNSSTLNISGSNYSLIINPTTNTSVYISGSRTDIATFFEVYNPLRSIDMAVDGTAAYIRLDEANSIIFEPTKTTITTDVDIDGILIATGSFTGSFTGNLEGTASYATTAASASFIIDENFGAYSPGIISGSAGWSQAFNGTLTLPTVQVALYDNADFRGKLRLYTVEGGTTGTGGIPALTNNTTNYIYIDYNNGTPIWGVNTTGILNNSSQITFMIVFRLDNFVHTLEFGDYGAGLATKLGERIVRTERFARESGLNLGLNTSTGILSISTGVAWNGPYRQVLNEISSNDVFFEVFRSSSAWTYRVFNNGSGSGNNTLNNGFYDNGTDLVAVGSGKYLTNWYYRGQEVNDHIYEVISQAQYDSVAEAQLAGEPTIPELVSSHGILVGRIIVQSGSFNGIVESAFTTAFQATTVAAHNDLTGIQGGSAGQYYHLTSDQYSNLVTENTANTFTQSQTITGSLNLTGDVAAQGRITAAQGFTGSFTGSFIGDGSQLTGIGGSGNISSNVRGITIYDPTTAEDVTMYYTSGSLTINEVIGVVRGSATPSVTVTLRYSSDRNATGTVIVNAQVVNSTTTAQSLTISGGSVTVPDNNFIWLETTARTGTVNELFIQF